MIYIRTSFLIYYIVLHMLHSKKKYETSLFTYLINKIQIYRLYRLNLIDRKRKKERKKERKKRIHVENLK